MRTRARESEIEKKKRERKSARERAMEKYTLLSLHCALARAQCSLSNQCSLYIVRSRARV